MNFKITEWFWTQYLLVFGVVGIYIVCALSPWYYSLSYKEAFINREEVEPYIVDDNGISYNANMDMINEYGDIIDIQGKVIERFEPEIDEEEVELNENSLVSGAETGIYAEFGGEAPVDEYGNPVFNIDIPTEDSLLPEQDNQLAPTLREQILKDFGEKEGIDPNETEFNRRYKDGGAFGFIDNVVMLGYVLSLTYVLGLFLSKTSTAIMVNMPTLIGLIIKSALIPRNIEVYKLSYKSVLIWWGCYLTHLLVFVLHEREVVSVIDEEDEMEKISI